MLPEHILTVRATVEPAHDEEFNRWYNQEHIPDVLQLIPEFWVRLGIAFWTAMDHISTWRYTASRTKQPS
jgi:hypothetical protein